VVAALAPTGRPGPLLVDGGYRGLGGIGGMERYGELGGPLFGPVLDLQSHPIPQAVPSLHIFILSVPGVQG
jgi:hypothetical protein